MVGWYSLSCGPEAVVRCDLRFVKRENMQRKYWGTTVCIQLHSCSEANSVAFLSRIFIFSSSNAPHSPLWLRPTPTVLKLAYYVSCPRKPIHAWPKETRPCRVSERFDEMYRDYVCRFPSECTSQTCRIWRPQTASHLPRTSSRLKP